MATVGYDFATDFKVESNDVVVDDGFINTQYVYRDTVVSKEGTKFVARPVEKKYEFKTTTTVPRVGCMIVGLGGNNGTTVVGSCIANQKNITWQTRTGTQTPNYYGSVTQASTVRLGVSEDGAEVNVPMNQMLPMLAPNDIVWGGWDISRMSLGDALERSQVFAPDLRRQLYPLMKDLVPLPSIYIPDFIASNQEERADNVITGCKRDMLETVRKDIRTFKEQNSLDQVIVLWSANTERFSELVDGVNDSADNLLAAIDRDEAEVSPSTMFAVASILEGSPFINGSPQNTFVPGVIDLAQRKNVAIAGDDFKSGQTKMKSVLVDFLIGAGMKPRSIVSYNHLGNNDGYNLSSPKQFRSKEISKSNVVDDMVASNRLLYKEGEHPDHCVVIKYVPYVGDSKRAMDEYTSEIFMGGTNTIVMHNTCEDSLLASPLIIDLVIMAELLGRIQIRRDGEEDFESWHAILSHLSLLLKAPCVKPGSPVVNAWFKQKAAVENVLRACVGLPPENNMLLEHKLQ